jgi:predicted DNA-binding protein (MmcQ/YjbR family)
VVYNPAMDFTKRLRPGVQRGEITCSIRIWQSPRVKAGNRYASTGVGQIEVDSIEQIELSDVTPELARESGFNGVVDLLKIAKHGSGTNVYLVRFHYVAPPGSKTAKGKRARTPARKAPSGEKQRKRVAKIVERLPEGEAKPAGRHMSLQVRKKNFGWFLVDHHGDGRVAINCKGSAEMHDMLRQLSPKQFHLPKYLGNKGWVGIWLDVPKLDWAVVELALREAYAKVAPKKLAAQVARVAQPF